MTMSKANDAKLGQGTSKLTRSSGGAIPRSTLPTSVARSAAVGRPRVVRQVVSCCTSCLLRIDREDPPGRAILGARQGPPARCRPVGGGRRGHRNGGQRVLCKMSFVAAHRLPRTALAGHQKRNPAPAPRSAASKRGSKPTFG